MNRYYKQFRALLEQDETELDPQVVDKDNEQNAMEGQLDDTTNPVDFETEPSLAGVRQKYIQRFQDIIAEFDRFAAYLNSDEEDSVNKFLNAVDKDGSIFSGVSRETNKITTAAESLASLAEAMKGYVLTGQRKLRDQEAALAEY